MSPIRTARPYAAKAIVEHEFDVNHLNVWVTFRFAMDQTVKPANGLWLCEVDDVLKAVSASAWQDEWTILLTVPAIASIPDRVTLEYDGPDENLRITWGKQWEPWGPILSSDATLLPYGSFKGNSFNWQQVAAQNTWYQISDVAITVGAVHKMTFQNNQELKIAVAGFYAMNYYLCLECSVAGKDVLTAILIDGNPLPMGMMHHQFGHGNEEYAIAAPSLANLVVNRLVGIGVMTPDAGNPTLTVKHCGAVIHEIGKA
ncbi:hypothetical protein KAR91_60445 [Candidatus Pacearchaeota archaeon]|nr:hypothetical protein [Candidatus Pacearchaeota archaeon]